ncbi:MAG: efflux RND transporter permease subunit [Xanthomonadales bacterium]|nr:efflux RND transporter permease subunit [Gammaproteobacteria bacterium]NNJ78304.1 efflux RND transporter permease subunit [Xanthomonadales bacterium]NNL05226.1 efflux RND transporter permease subunit [Xanthomonadales bacterium]
MPLTRISLSNPVAVVVACILVAIFGMISLDRLPIQMTPDISRPQISIETAWRAAAPNEIESEIIEQQEDVLRSTPGLLRMQSSANFGRGSINLEFVIGTDMNRALIEVMNRLNQVPRYPVDAFEPVISVGGSDFDRVIAWFTLATKPGNSRDISSYQDFVDDSVITRIERVPGVSSAGSFGGRPHEVRITFDPFKAANIGVDLTEVQSQLGANADVSAGLNEVGRRDYTVRFSGKYDVEELGGLVLEWRDGKPVFLRDVAEVGMEMVDVSNMLTRNGNPSIAFYVIPETGVNVYDVMDGVKAVVADLKANELERAGLDVYQSSDNTVYITASVGMVRNNLLLGVSLAIGVLWWFLRKFRATLIVALAIPFCGLIAFMVLDFAGRSLNIISLAGLAFATGMVLDAAIVVLENIFRQREAGLTGDEASMRGVSQVWGALLASTATTVAIFMPVIFLENEAGQLFSDLAVTISAAVVASLLVAITVLPTAASNWIKGEAIDDHHKHWWRWVTNHIMTWTDTQRRRWIWVTALTLIPVALAVTLIPPADYLPEGKRNFFFGVMITAPGMGMETAREELVGVVAERLEPYLAGEKEPQLGQYFMGSARGWGTFMGGEATDPDDMGALLGVFNSEIMRGFPDTFGFVSRASVFGGSRGGRKIDIDLSAESFESLLAAGRTGFYVLMQEMPEAQIQPLPGLELAEPEIRLLPDDRKIAEVGWNRTMLSTAIRAMGDGAFLGEYFDGTRRYNVVLRAENWYSPEELGAIPVYTPGGGVQSLGELVRVNRTAGPSSIRRIDRKRTLTLQVTPPSEMSMEEALSIIQDKVAPVILDSMPEDGTVKYRGTAEALDEALTSMTGSFILAVVILYLLISALFRSFRDSLLVILTIPMATVGGILSLRLVDFALSGTGGQAMDLLTMIGFVILLGLVVNNAILLVYRARDAEREGMDRREAVESAIRLRLRPILMSTTTSVFGMLPLMLVPGAGTELYRGMACVIVGGMLVSTLFTLILLPSLLRMNEAPDQVGSTAAEAA